MGRLVGDTPELCPLDSNLFSDYEYAMAQNVAFTADLEHNYPEKFLLGTPAEVQDTMMRTWAMCPTCERIVQDILRIPDALKDIIAAHCAKVPERDNRRGRRKTRKYVPPACPEAEARMEAKWRRLDAECGL